MNNNGNLLNELRIDRDAPPPPAGNKGLIVIGIGVLCLAVAVGAWFFFSKEAGVGVRISSAVSIGGSGSTASVLDATGYVVARREATVSSRITGRVLEVLIEEGMLVEAGQVMATLDVIDAEAQRTLSHSQLEAARSQSADIQAQLKEAEANAARLDRLVVDKLVSRQQHEQAIAARDSLRARLATADRNVQVALDTLRIAENGLDHTIVRAPFRGVVIAKAAQPGEIVSPLSAGGGFTRTGIGTIVDMDSLEVEVDVGEAFIGRVKPKMPVEVTLNAYQDSKIPAEVIAIIPTADRAKATLKVRIAFKVRDPRIVPEMGVRVSFLDSDTAATASAPRRSGVSVPADALVNRSGMDAVFVLEGDTVELRRVTVGRSLGDNREILEGLASGDMVVDAPPRTLADGVRVRVLN